jgi:CheY-like chemotaxis protein
MDIVMPGMSGFEAIRQLREKPETADIPVVVLSVVQNEESSYRLGAVDYVDKPIEEEKLLEVVEKVLAEGLKILVYDSDGETRQHLEEVLTHKGYHLIFAQNGLDLLVQARKEQPQLIVMDLHLSDMDGYEVLRRLNRRPETVDIPVIAMTSSPDETLGKVIAVGANDLVKKPLDMEALLAEIGRFMEDVKERK